MSWPYVACVGIKSDGERCQGRAGLNGLYCHHHDPARKSPTSTPTASATALRSLNDLGQRMAGSRSSITLAARGSVPDETTLAAFAEAMRSAREAHR